MKNRILAPLAVAALVLPFAANAAEPKEGFYIAGFGGPNWSRNSDTEVAGTDSEIDFNNGFGFGGAVGYAFGNAIRTEFETTYRKNAVDAITGAGSEADAQNGDVSSLAFMANALVDIYTDSAFTPYLGFGIGYARMKADNVGTLTGLVADDTSGAFAYQAIAGFAVGITQNLDFTADYRYFNVSNVEYDTTTGGARAEIDSRNHSVMLGLRYTFGDTPAPAPIPVAAAAPVPPAPAPAPVPAAPVAAPKAIQSFIVFFDWDQSTLTPQAKDVLKSVADTVLKGGVAKIEVVGHADTSGDKKYNQGLSERRGNAVRDELVALGVPANDVATRGAGEADQMIPTADSVREAQNRRATISLN